MAAVRRARRLYALRTASGVLFERSRADQLVACNSTTTNNETSESPCAVGFNRATVDDGTDVNKHWTAVQIVLPIIIAVVVALIAGVLFLFYRRRLKQRYTHIADVALHHQRSESTSTLGFDRIFGPGSSRGGTIKRNVSVAWESARLQAPRRLGGLLADRRTVHHRTRGADWSIDVDTERSGEAFGSGSGDSEGALKQGRESTASLASKLSAMHESALGLPSMDAADGPVLRTIQDAPAVNTKRPTPGVARGGRLPLIHVVSKPPRRGFNLDDIDSARSPTVVVDAHERDSSSQALVVAIPAGVSASAEAREDEQEESLGEGVMLISRSPGQDFNSMGSVVSPVETDGFGAFNASTENGHWPAALTDSSSVLSPTLPRTRPQFTPPSADPPPSFTSHQMHDQSELQPHAQHPDSRLISSPHPDLALLFPSSVRAAGTPVPHAGPSALSLDSSLLPNARLFGAVESLRSAVSITSGADAPPSSHSSDNYTVPNPFTFDWQRVGAANPLRLVSASPPVSDGSNNQFLGTKRPSFDLAA